MTEAIIGGSGQPFPRTTVPSSRTARYGVPAAPGPGAGPHTIAHVARTLASTQDGPATVTVRHPLRATSPVRGSTMWWATAPPVRHRRTVVDDVARPPYHRVTASSASSNAVRCESATPTVQPSGGGGPDTAMSPPTLTSTPSPVADAAASAARSTASALAVAPRSTQTPQGTTTVPDGCSWTACHPGTRSTRTVGGRSAGRRSKLTS